MNNDPCKHCGACRNPETCACCGACRNCGKYHSTQTVSPPQFVPVPYPVPMPQPWIPPEITWTITGATNLHVGTISEWAQQRNLVEFGAGPHNAAAVNPMQFMQGASGVATFDGTKWTSQALS